jgi:hypothetical protein
MSDHTVVSRRLVAVFAADVEGYSRLMGADEVTGNRDPKRISRSLQPVYSARLVDRSQAAADCSSRCVRVGVRTGSLSVSEGA